MGRSLVSLTSRTLKHSHLSWISREARTSFLKVATDMLSSKIQNQHRSTRIPKRFEFNWIIIWLQTSNILLFLVDFLDPIHPTNITKCHLWITETLLISSQIDSIRDKYLKSSFSQLIFFSARFSFFSACLFICQPVLIFWLPIYLFFSPFINLAAHKSLFCTKI